MASALERRGFEAVLGSGQLLSYILRNKTPNDYGEERSDTAAKTVPCVTVILTPLIFNKSLSAVK
ncbi:hypothetical protein BSK66_07930 [Paenibacillus odorifer]|uniref:hypothetical protein n=1 Tax=Paenibacillus TaxID=44249 RepID=UPI0003E1BFAE|nr:MULTISPECIES: hypothetical protein [Paenibacillus]ETT64932.1 hypothetical protein C171_07947 [Paenibacillus sp. FSL H8-237]OME61050.1 hypothetical protein BSK66_07930 [Paenibacillus odorifer]